MCFVYVHHNLYAQEGTSAEVDSLEAVLNKRDVDMAEYIDQFLYDSEPDPEGLADLYVARLMLGKEEDEEEVETYDSQTDLPDFDAQGTYTMDLVSHRRMLRRERRAAVKHLELPEATESTLMAHVDYSEFEDSEVYCHT